MTDCNCCKQKLAEYEEDKIDCGHYACNSCAYEDFLNRRYCEKCWEKYRARSMEAQKWIVSDAEDPEPYKTVLFLEDSGEMWFGHYDCACNLFVYYFGREQKDDKKFTHWMLLPQPPKQEVEE